MRGAVGAAGAAAVTTVPACGHGTPPHSETPASVGTPKAESTTKVSLSINGKAAELDVGPDDVALHAVRDQLGLTGSKLGCGHGACGACTMQVDGTPVASCILPATSLQGRTVTTVEGLAKGSSLHAVQRAFMANDALQCGFCTPGFVVEAAAFVDAWREEHGDSVPPRDDIAAALSGHLCRCGAYEQIYAAVAAAAAGKHDTGTASPRYEAREKVTGEAQYTVDVQLEGMLHARSLHSPHGHAKVTKLDWSKALALPGVHGAFELLTASRMVRFAGQEIVAIAAVDEPTADAAVKLVEVEYDVRPAVVTPQAALAEGAEVVQPKGKARKHPPNASEGPLLPEKWVGNLRGPLGVFSHKKGKSRKGIEDARTHGQVVEGTFTTHVQCHTCLEPHAAVARWEGSDRLEVYFSTQAVSHMAHEIAEHFRLKKDNVRVIAHYVGGGFGSKAVLTTEAVIPIELARLTGRPVRYALPRPAEIMIGGNRPGTKTDVTLATHADGSIAGMKAVTHNYSGVAVGGATTPLFRIIYPEGPRELEDWDVTTHSPPGKPFRAPGGPPAYWALEQSIDDLAYARGEDPVAVRRRWDPNPARNALYAWVETLPAWRDRADPQSDRGRFRRGVGLACGAWFCFAEPKSRIDLHAGKDGVAVRQGSQDMGNGTRSTLARLVAQELGLSPRDVTVEIGSSEHPWGPMAGGSRTTATVTPAVEDATAKLKEELVRFARKTLGLSKPKIGASGIEHEGGTMPWAEAIAQSEGIDVIGRRKRDPGGYFLPPLVGGLAVEKAVSGCLIVTQLEVDTRLGKTRVLETWGGFGIGRIVHPQLATSQAVGGITQGISFALYEERRLDPTNGYLLSGGLEDYRIAGIGDVGPIHVHFDESGYEKIRGRAVGLGELVTISVPGAIGNAMFHATGWRPRDLPLRPDVVLKEVVA